MGCLDAAGGCLAGNTDQACGVLAEACTACDDQSYCDEGQCTPLPACTPENCEGCCDGDACLGGGDLGACGRDGRQCSSCPAKSTCNEGRCELPCEGNCDGCCDASGDCIPLDETNGVACGLDGVACETCDADFECAGGTCISTACAMTCDGCCAGAQCNTGDAVDACGQGGSACEACPAGTECAQDCVALPGALWDVFMISAELPATLPGGANWDALAGAPDPFVRFEIDGLEEDTSVADDTYLPEWNEVVMAGLTTEQLLEPATYSIRDADVVGSDLGGTCTFPLMPHQFGLGLIIDCMDGGDVLWTLQFAVLAAE